MKFLKLLFKLITRRFVRQERKKFILLTVFLTLVLMFVVVLFSKDFSQNKPMQWGVTFSKKYAIELNMNWQKVYVDILYDLGADKIRIPIYWDDVERVEGEYDFEDYDWMLDAARLAKAEIVLVVGRRQPRWPECFSPYWATQLPDSEVEEKILELIKEEVNHFKRYENVTAWQVENEPLLSIFGECPPPNKDFLQAEIDLVESLDSRPIIVTDSGELSSWFSVAQLTQNLGTTMYRIVWNRTLGYTYYPLPPAYYRYKADLIKWLNPNVNKIIISELQVEPWTEGIPMVFLPLERQFKSMSFARMRMNLRFAQATGFDQTYLWGVEWWYWLKERKNHPEFWEFGQRLWQVVE